MVHLRNIPLSLFVLCWLLLAAGGVAALADYAARPGSAGNPPQVWPEQIAILRTANRPTLVMMIHPECPCSRASLGELERILGHYPGKLDVHLLMADSETRPEWRESDLWRRVRALSGVSITSDHSEQLFRIFDSYTSGHVLLYGAGGKLVFSGGITASRGHEGMNAGRQIVESYLEGIPEVGHEAPVFGCNLPRGAA